MNQYAGSCPLTISIGDDAPFMPLAAGEVTHEVEAGLVPLGVRTTGSICDAAQCTFVASMVMCGTDMP